MIGLATQTIAQNTDDFRGVFNHLGANLSVGTQGVGIGLATPLTPYLEVSMGMNIMPAIKAKGDANVNDITTGGMTIPLDKVEIKGNFARTTLDFAVNCYPFGNHNSFFVAAGFSFAGKKIAKLSGHSEEIKNVIATYPQFKDEIMVEIDKYNLRFDDNGDVYGDARVKAFRPYIGLGYGRLVPKKRIGFRVELGCQFHDKIEIYQDEQEVDISDYTDSDDTISDIVNKVKVYPVLKFAITGRIL